MTDIEQKAAALSNEVRREFPQADDYAVCQIALRRAIEQHLSTKQELSDFRQEVSDVFEAWFVSLVPESLKYLIIPTPKLRPKPKPDPLVEAIAQADNQCWNSKAEYAAKIRAALEARGLEIREKNDDQ